VLAARVATAAALIAALLGALFWLPKALLAALIALLGAGAGHEWAKLCGLRAAAAAAYGLAIAAGFAALFVAGPRAAALAFGVAALFWIALAPAWLFRGMRSEQRGRLIAAGLVVLIPACLAMTSLEPQRLLAVLVLVWVADTAAYFVGRAWGRRKLAPSISPGKTREGALGGVVGALLYAIICKRFFDEAGWMPYLAAAAVLAMLSIVGDLFESAAKRRAGVKDSGALLPGHGGILDRIDSATAVLPVAAALLTLMKGTG
jgi:phosphatidate cytidylyltransferase